MSEFAQRLSTLHQRVGRVLSDRERLVAANTVMQAELHQAQRNTDVLQARITELEREVEVLRAVESPAREDRSSGTKERIDELVVEIDRCLALLTA